MPKAIFSAVGSRNVTPWLTSSSLAPIGWPDRSPQLDQWPWGLDSPDWQLLLNNPWKLSSPRPVALFTIEETNDSLSAWVDDVNQQLSSPPLPVQHTWASNTPTASGSSVAGNPRTHLVTASVSKHTDSRTATRSQSSLSSASVSSPSTTFDATAPSPSIAASPSQAFIERKVGPSLYAQLRHMRPIRWVKPHHLSSDVRQLRRLVLELVSTSSTETDSTGDVSAEVASHWFAKTIGTLCAVIVRTCEVMQLSMTPPLVCGHIRVICAMMQCRRAELPKLLPWLCIMSHGEAARSVYRAVLDTIGSMLSIEDGSSLLIRGANGSPYCLDMEGELKTLLSIDKDSVSINVAVTALKMLPAEAKAWRLVPQLLVQVLNVLKRLSFRESKTTAQLVALRDAICLRVERLAIASRLSRSEPCNFGSLAWSGSALVRELSGLNVCMRVWEAVPSNEIVSVHDLARGLAAFTEYMARPILEDHDGNATNIPSSTTGNSSSVEDTEMTAHVRALFSPEEIGEQSALDTSVASQSATVYGHAIRHRFSVSTATSGTHFDPSNSTHRLAKEIFETFEEDVSSVGTYNSHIL